MDKHDVAPRSFTFGGHDIHVLCRRTPEECAKVTITLQMTVEEVFDSFWNFGGNCQQESNSVTGHQEQPEEAAGRCPPQEPRTCQSDQEEQNSELLGLDVWPAAIRLCEYLSRNPLLVAGRKVVELGAGMGLPGLLCTKLGACSVLASDYVPEVVARLKENGLRNNVEPPTFMAVSLDWTDLSSMEPENLHTSQVILLADVLYQSQLVGPLVGAMLKLLHPEGVALLGHLPRRAIVMDEELQIPVLVEKDEPFHVFCEAVQHAGLHTRILSDGKEQGKGMEAGKQKPLLIAFAWSQCDLEELPLPSFLE